MKFKLTNSQMDRGSLTSLKFKKINSKNVAIES